MGQGNQTEQLFVALAQQLRLPLLQIARLSERINGSTAAQISVISEHALRLVDAFAQSQQQTEMAFEPLTTSSVLYDVAQQLQPFAKQYEVTILLDQQGKVAPVMSNRQALKTMLTLLGASLIEAGQDDEAGKRELVLGTHRTARGTVVGVFSPQVALSQQAVTLTRQLHGRASQVVPALGMSGGAGLAVADKLSQQLAAPLKAYRHRSLIGLGTLLLPSHQLQLVS